MKIQAAVIRDKGGPFVIETLDLADPKGDEIRVRIVATGICHTDLIIRDQFYPTPLPVVLGHEGAGFVEDVGPDVKLIKPGDRVLLSYAACGSCPSCSDGKASYCWHHMEMNFSGRRYSGKTWDIPSPITKRNGDVRSESISGAFFHQSSFASHAIATERNAVVVDSGAPLEILAPLGCGFQTGAGAVLNTLKPKPGQSIAITGAGSVGLAAVMAARVSGCDPIIVVDLQPERLALAKSLGATHTINPAKGDIVEQVKAIVPTGVSYSIETTANPKVFRAAVDILETRGTCGLIGGAKLGTEVSFEMTHILFGRTIRGILQGDSDQKTFLPKLVRLQRDGQFPIERLITHYPLTKINEAVAAMSSGSVIKPVLTTSDLT
jgi:aryl-alcohol dehydrogenase